MRLWVSPCNEKDESVFITKTESCLQLGGRMKLYMIELIDEWEHHWLLGCVCALSFLPLCSASYKAAFPRFQCHFLSLLLVNERHWKEMGSTRKIRPFLFLSQGASPARSCLLCGFCVPQLGTPHCSSVQDDWAHCSCFCLCCLPV